MIAAYLICLGMLAADESQAAPPPLTAEQITQVRALVTQTQADHATARRELAKAQDDLARCYAQYELDEKEVARLQGVILQQQRKLLESHHRMQQELRTIVGAERFVILSRRIENALKNSPPANSSTIPPSK